MVAALARGNCVVPYRTSKLTYLLKPVFRGKVLLFANVSPAEYNISETASTLNFARRCGSVKLGKSKRKLEAAELQGMRKRIRHLEDRLRACGEDVGRGGGGVSRGEGGSRSGPRGDHHRQKDRERKERATIEPLELRRGRGVAC